MRCAHVRRFTFAVVIVLMVWMIPTPMLAQDPCDPGPNFTDSSSLVVLLGNSVACSSVGITADNGYYRNCDLAANGITTPIDIVGIEIGIEVADPGPGFVTQPVNINLYYDNDNDPAPLAGLIPIESRSFELPLLNAGLQCFQLDALVDQ